MKKLFSPVGHESGLLKGTRSNLGKLKKFFYKYRSVIGKVRDLNVRCSAYSR